MASLAEIRQQYPQYEDMSDRQLADALHKKFYSDMDRAEFDQKMGVAVTAPEGLVPGSPDYAKWAAEQARAGKKLPQVSQTPPEWQMPEPESAQAKYERNLQNIRERYYPNLSDAQWTRALSEGITNLQPHDAGGLFNDTLQWGLSDEARGVAGAVTNLFNNPGQAFQDYQQFEQARREYGAETAGPMGVAAQVGGALLSGRPDRAAAQAATTGGRVLQGALDAGKQGAAFGAASTEGGLEDRVRGAVTGGAFGGAGGAAVSAGAGAIANTVNRAAQRGATNAAIKNAPAAADLKATSQALFQQVDRSGVTVNPQRFGQEVTGLVQKAVKDRMNQTLDPKAYAAFQEIARAANDLQRGGAMTVSDLHTLRQIAQKAATSAEGRDAMFANRIIDMLDDFVTKSGNLNGGPQAGNALLEAISTWGRSRRVGLIEEAIYKAQNQASGFENGIRVQFRQLLQNPKTRNMFTAVERQAIEDVVRGNTLTNLTKLVGKFGFGSGQAGNVMGGFLGGMGGFAASGGNPLVAGAVALGASGARKASEKLTTRAADRAARVVATPNIPQVPPIPMPALDRAGVSLVRGGQPLLSRP